MVETIGIIATVLAVAGVWLNNRQRIACFKLWIVSNALSLGIHCSTGIWTLAVRDVIFVCLAFEGIWLWKRKGRVPLEIHRDAIIRPSYENNGGWKPGPVGPKPDVIPPSQIIPRQGCQS